MKPTKLLFSSALFLAILSTVSVAQEKENNFSPVDKVNPYIGNISHLLVPTFPTIHLPNSLLRVIPARNDFTSDRLSGLPIVSTSHRGSSAFSLYPFQTENNTCLLYTSPRPRD